ncbi:hypothetical protein SAMN00017477_1017 [Peptoniphilus asaccharolyticus DSM 20463]|uniref:Uncharacterized protein n=1 Tax=Peptoniphilus asaccharolyticus DSM 20463 TaxID=573058 RepID=A0A1W1V169_PEPAS|nr:hypothetical protein [Peptoniphilus asaccharolyticus]MBL7575513.1 hypothetical protein [Peptoniphilus asaccharolyticus]SMB87099.1 hypothetical protein SAMN00017477_1017 [Peptoniphilus asaccharolyticus DSM 20463]
MSEFDINKLKNVISKIAADYISTLTFSNLVHAKLESLEPLTFKRDDDVELKEEFLVVPRYRKFTEEEVGHYFVFQSNQEGQVWYYMYEASSPQGSNGEDYYFDGTHKLKGNVKCKLKGNCSDGSTTLVTEGTIELFEGEIIEIKHDKGIRK